MKKKKIVLSLLISSVFLGLASCSAEEPINSSSIEESINNSTGLPVESSNIGSSNIESSNIESSNIESSNIESSGAASGSLEYNDGDITIQGEIKVNEAKGMQESAYILFEKISNADYAIYYSLDNKPYVKANSDIVYIREYQNEMRADLMGLTAGNYKVKLVPVNKGNEHTDNATVVDIKVDALDRSGYAHFNYTEGVGAYNDDGTLKDNAIVIYVTDENKDYVMEEVCSEYSDINLFDIPGDSWNKKASGIGWWLNNAQYTKKDKNGNPGNTYSASGTTLGMYSVTENHPVVIRFVGKVLTPEGCTAFNSTDEGGTENDNGHMARMKDLRNVTIEGVGNDAIIEGWGFHFMSTCSDGTRGRSFEARNLTFVNYPEDALGMEGTMTTSDSQAELDKPVRNCWVHHCTFFPGYCQNPPENDKTEGDGSCDFKRGYGFTMSYCYYEYCHKTNLIGSSSDSIQYDISFHHNVWYNCGSRIPLVRNSNIHFYNNLLYEDFNLDNKFPSSSIHTYSCSKVNVSYVSSLRANSYMYAENNYYDGAKQTFETGEGSGAAKCFGNIYSQCYQTPAGANEVTSREEKVANNCKYTFGNVDYSSFDTDPKLFYYDSVNKKSDCYLTNAIVAREECLKYAGSQYRTILDETTLSITKINSNENTPTNSVDLSTGSYTAAMPNAKGDSTVGNIIYSNISGISGSTIKFKGQGVTFKLTDYAKVSVTLGGSATYYAMGYLKGSDGTVYLTCSGEAILAPGIYYIASAQKDKETTVSSLSFTKYNSDEADQKLIEDFNNKALLIPSNITYTKECYSAINDAKEAYDKLNDSLKANVNYQKVSDAYNSYIALGKAYVEGLINAIGTVDNNSGSKISQARKAYEELQAIDSTITITNLQTLQTAEKQFESYAIDACINKINAIGTVTLDSKDDIFEARSLYDNLSEEKKASITNYSKLLEAEEKYEDLEKAYEVDTLIANCNESLSSYEAIVNAYNALTANQQKLVTDQKKYVTIKINYTKGLISAIGTVTSESQSAINKARAQYDSLTETEKTSVDNYQTLVDAESQIKSMVKEYTMSFDSSENLTASSGKTAQGFDYSCNKFDNGWMKIKKSSNNYITSSELNSCDVTITIEAKMLDSSNADTLEILITYEDGTSEVKTMALPENKVSSLQTITISGKTVKTVSLIGTTTNTSKNVAVKSFTIVYKK